MRAVFPIQKGKHQKQILSFLQESLQIISRTLNEEAKHQGCDLSKLKEDNLSGEITRLLEDRLRENNGDYMFNFEAKKGPDMLIYIRPYTLFSHPLFVIEAKRLPPTSSREYVKGSRGGIERFKKESHGKEHNIAAMLGYVQTQNFTFWHNEINSWIEDLIADPKQNPEWKDQDKLKASTIANYKSKHTRTTQQPITIYHFWINLCQN